MRAIHAKVDIRVRSILARVGRSRFRDRNLTRFLHKPLAPAVETDRRESLDETR